MLKPVTGNPGKRPLPKGAVVALLQNQRRLPSCAMTPRLSGAVCAVRLCAGLMSGAGPGTRLPPIALHTGAEAQAETGTSTGWLRRTD